MAAPNGLQAAALAILVATAAEAHGEDVLVVVQRLNKVENPSWIEKSWSSAVETRYGRELMDEAARSVGAATAAGVAATSGPTRSKGNQHWGAVQAPPGYTICRAAVKDPSVNCKGGALAGVLRANQPGKVDGLHWYMVVPRRSIGASSCWVDGTFVVTFVAILNKSQYRCNPVNEAPEFQYGRKALARDLP